MTDRPEQRPEGRLIGVALKRSRLSGRRAAELAGMSEGRWRQIVSGYISISKGVYAPVEGPAETVAKMAKVVGVTPEQLKEAGRADAAEELRELTTTPRASDTFPRTDVGRELLELAGTDRFLDRVREVIPQLPAEDRSLVEEVLAAYLASEVGHREDQERKRRMVDRIIRRRRARGSDAADNGGGQAAAG